MNSGSEGGGDLGGWGGGWEREETWSLTGEEARGLRWAESLGSKGEGV